VYMDVHGRGIIYFLLFFQNIFAINVLKHIIINDLYHIQKYA